MKVAGGLNYVTGPMGAGKSLYGVRRIVAHVIAGHYAVTNVELLPGWSERVVWHVARFRSKGKRERIAERLESFYVYETELETAMRYPGSPAAARRAGSSCGTRPTTTSTTAPGETRGALRSWSGRRSCASSGTSASC